MLVGRVIYTSLFLRVVNDCISWDFDQRSANVTIDTYLRPKNGQLPLPGQLFLKVFIGNHVAQKLDHG
jgi:hypothetical protein